MAKYDAARSDRENARHWRSTDALSAASANSLEVRKRLRERARYESANGPYCRGMVLTKAYDLIGTSPRLQCLHPNRDWNRQIEQAFAQWARAVGLARKLRTMAQAKTVDGETFAVLTTNPNLGPLTPVELDVVDVECDRVTDPTFQAATSDNVLDGIQYDDAGRPVAYYVLNEHPGDFVFLAQTSFKKIPARQVLHWFRSDRSGQLRGISELTPALEPLNDLRRYTKAVIGCAEVAASYSGVLETETSSADIADDQVGGTPFDEIPISRNTLVTLPNGYKLSQLEAAQPTAIYDTFVKAKLNEIARCLNMPFNVAAGNSSGYNYASGRLDFQNYFKSMSVERSEVDLLLLSRIFAAFLDEAVMIPDLLPDGLDIFNLPYRWFFDGRPHVDPVKEATALQLLLERNATTLSDYYAEQGQDWEDALIQRSREKQRERELGIEPVAKIPGAPVPAADPTADPTQDEEVPVDG